MINRGDGSGHLKLATCYFCGFYTSVTKASRNNMTPQLSINIWSEIFLSSQTPLVDKWDVRTGFLPTGFLQSVCRKYAFILRHGRCYRTSEAVVRRYRRPRQARMDMPPLRQSFVFSPAQDASASISQLELGRPTTSQIPKPVNGGEEFVGPRQVDHANGDIETE